MNRLIEIWCQKGFPLKTHSENYDVVIGDLQKRLDKIYETFTGENNESDITSLDLTEKDEKKVVRKTKYRSQKNLRCSRGPPSKLFF